MDREPSSLKTSPGRGTPVARPRHASRSAARTSPAPRPRQLKLPLLRGRSGSTEHGGGTTRGRRKTRRPLDPRRPIHLTMRASRAVGAWSLLHPANVRHIDAFVAATARKWGVRIQERANVGNHLHLLIRAPSRAAFQAFLRELAGGIAMRVTGSRKSHGIDGGRFWDELAYTRVVEWGRDFRRVSAYIVTNLFEAAGLISRREKALGLRARALVPRPPDKSFC